MRADQRLRASAVVVGLSLVLIASGCRRGPTLDQEALRQTAAHARPLDPKDLAAPGREVVSLRSRGDRLCLSRVRAELGQRVELCGSTTAAGPQTVVIAGRAGDREWERELSVAGRVYAGTNSDAALGDGAFFAAWVEATGGSEVIRVVTLASGTGEVQHDERLYGQPWGLQLLSIGLHRPSGVLLLAWKDISTASSSGALMLGAFPLATRKASAAREIFRGDGWEKSSPQFLANGDELALTVSTGQRFGAMSHAGKAALGLAFIEPDGGLGDYRYIAATQPVRQVLGIGVDRLVMYRPEGEPAAAIPFSEAWVVGKRRAAP